MKAQSNKSYTMGDPDPRSFSRGKRGISGSLVFTVFDRHALVKALINEQPPEGWQHHGPTRSGEGADFPRVDRWADDFQIGDDGELEATSLIPSEYADQIPPFDIVINFINEYGQSAKMEIIGVEILNEGQGMSVDDMSTEQQCTFVARKIDYIEPTSLGE